MSEQAENTEQPASQAAEAQVDTQQPAEQQQAPAQPIVPATPPAAPIQQPEPVRGHIVDERLKDDKFFNKFTESYMAGKHQDFLSVVGTDWKAKDDVAVLTASLTQKYSSLGLSPEDQKILIEKEFEEKYGLGASYEDDSIEARRGKAQLKLDAAQSRNGYIAEQEQFMAQSFQPQAQQQVDPVQQQAEMQKRENEWISQNLSDPAYKEFETNRVIKMGEGDTAYNFGVDPDLNIAQKIKDGFQDALARKDKDGNIVTDAHGVPVYDMAAYADVVNYAYNKAKIHKALIEHGMSLERKRIDETSRNPGGITNHSIPAGSDKPAGVWKGDYKPAK